LQVPIDAAIDAEIPDEHVDYGLDERNPGVFILTPSGGGRRVPIADEARVLDPHCVMPAECVMLTRLGDAVNGTELSANRPVLDLVSTDRGERLRVLEPPTGEWR
jgi:hypothetical protein